MADRKFQVRMRVKAYDGSSIESSSSRLSAFRALYLCLSDEERAEAKAALKALDEKYPPREVSDG